MEDSCRKFDNIDKIQIDQIRNSFFNENSEKFIKFFVKRLQDYALKPWINTKDILNLANDCHILVDQKIWTGFLNRKSLIPGKISGAALQKYLLPILENPPQKEIPVEKPLAPTPKKRSNRSRLREKKPQITLNDTKKGFLHPDSQKESKFPFKISRNGWKEAWGKKHSDSEFNLQN